MMNTTSISKARRPFAAFAALVMLSLLPSGSSVMCQQYLIKFATVAPDGSTWLNVMKEFDRAVRTESKGKLGFKIYPGGVQGDEKDVLRKIKLGQIHSAGITGNGLTTVAPRVRIMDSPFLFRSYDEADYILHTFEGEFDKAFEENGFVNLGWAEVGFVNIFSNAPVHTVDDMRSVKMWMWEGDPIAEATFEALGIRPIPLSITEVLTSLQTGLIDAVYSSPLAMIAMQWFTRVKYMLNIPLADAQGAVVISKKKFDEIPTDLQEVLLRNGRTFMRKLTELTRKENAVEILKKNGITVVNPPTADAVARYEVTGSKARSLLVGKLYDQDLLRRVEQAVSDFRAHQKK